MPAPYVLPGANDTDNLYHIFSFVTNSSTGGMFMPLMLAVIWIVAFIGGISEGRISSRAFIYASYISSILAVMLSLIGLLNHQYMYFLFLLLGAGVVWYQLATAPGS